MADDQLFVSQETLDIWMAEDRVSVDGDVLTLPGGTRQFSLKTAVHFLADVTETGDPHGLLGKVKDVEALTALGGEHVSDSVILGDTAYEVKEGFLGTPSGTAEEAGDADPGEGALADLARFFSGPA
ncbi:MAG: hypothetical protein AB8H86_15405 [Polyangiales bacterium]